MHAWFSPLGIDEGEERSEKEGGEVVVVQLGIGLLLHMFLFRKYSISAFLI